MREQMILSDEQINDLANPLVEILEKFYEDEENVKRFQEWLKKEETVGECVVQKDYYR